MAIFFVKFVNHKASKMNVEQKKKKLEKNKYN